MSQEDLATSYMKLNKLVIGFLSVVVPVSSTLAGCMTYQFVNYLNTKSFIQTQLGHQPLPHHHNLEKSKDVLTDEQNGHENQHESDLANKPYNLNQCDPDLFDFQFQGTYGHRLEVVDPQDATSVTPAGGQRRTSLEPVSSFFLFFHDRSNVIVFILWISNLLGVCVEIVVFKSLAQHTLVDSGLTIVYSWPLLTLVIINYLITSGTRIYFARLASTMLRSPKNFLICSLVLLFMSLGGTIFQLILIGKHVMNFDQIARITSLNDNNHQGMTHSDFFSLILINRIPLNLLQIVWVGPVLIWYFLISAVLLFNFFDEQRRCRFGSAEGKCSLVIMLLFETLLLVTLSTFMVQCTSLILGGTLNIDFERLSTLHAGLSTFLTKLNTISVFCSLQHKVNERLRIGQRYMLNSQKRRGSTASGLDYGFGCGAGELSLKRDTPGIASSIEIPHFADEEVEGLGEDETDIDYSHEDSHQQTIEDINIEPRIPSVYPDEGSSINHYRFENLDHDSDRFEPNHRVRQLKSLVENLNLPSPEPAQMENSRGAERASTPQFLEFRRSMTRTGGDSSIEVESTQNSRQPKDFSPQIMPDQVISRPYYLPYPSKSTVLDFESKITTPKPSATKTHIPTSYSLQPKEPNIWPLQHNGSAE